MKLRDVEAYCDQRANSERTTPFGPSPLVYKLGGKIFALLGQYQERDSVSLKCDPDRAMILRDSYPSIIPGYHLNKTHWNTVILDRSVPAGLIKELIDHSYALVDRTAARAPRRAARSQAKKPRR